MTIASNRYTHLPVQSVRRYVTKSQSYEQVSQPNLINLYKGMGGVDVLDRLLSSYRPTLRGKKWWWSLFLNAVNITIVAAWRVHTQVHSAHSISYLDFRREIALCLLKVSVASKLRLGHRMNLPDDVIVCGIDHNCETTSQGRCRVCGSNTRKKCVKCDVRLHSERGKGCWNAYHQCND